MTEKKFENSGKNVRKFKKNIWKVQNNYNKNYLKIMESKFTKKKFTKKLLKLFCSPKKNKIFDLIQM